MFVGCYNVVCIVYFIAMYSIRGESTIMRCFLSASQKMPGSCEYLEWGEVAACGGQVSQDCPLQMPPLAGGAKGMQQEIGHFQFKLLCMEDLQ